MIPRVLPMFVYPPQYVKSAKKVEMAEKFKKNHENHKKSIQNDPQWIPDTSDTFLTLKQHFQASFSSILGHFSSNFSSKSAENR